MVLRVREARPDDAALLAVVHIAAWQAGYAGQLPDDYLASLSNDMPGHTERWRARLEANESTTLVAVDDEAGALFGFTSYGVYRDGGQPDSTGELWVINLHPDSWGKGIAATLFQAAVDGLRAQGYTQAVLWVLDSNVRARRFYEKHGWKPDGQTKADDNGTIVLDEVRYAIPLG